MDPSDIAARVRTLRERNGTRDSAMRDVRSIREGRWEEVAPDLFPEAFTEADCCQLHRRDRTRPGERYRSLAIV